MKYLFTLLLLSLCLIGYSQGYGETYNKAQQDSAKLARQLEKQLKINPGLYKSDLLLEKAGGSGQTAFACYAVSGIVFFTGIVQSRNVADGKTFDVLPYYYASGAIATIGLVFKLRAWSLLKRAGIEGRKEKQLLLKTKGNGLALVYNF